MSVLEDLMRSMDPATAERVGQQLGVDSATASDAISKALPMLLAGLSRNAKSGGLSDLASALDRDHDGSILDDVSGYLDRGPGNDGGGILDHVFGGSRSQVESALGGASNLDGSSAANLLQMLAPLVMGALGRQMRGRGLDEAGLGAALGQEEKALRGASSGGFDLLTSVLDADGDGSMVDDLADKGKDLLGALLKGS